MNDLAMWSLILGFFVPPVVAVIQQPRWNDGLRAVVTFVFSILVALGSLVFDDTLGFHAALDAENWISATLLVLVTAISTYKGLWQKTGIAPAIESSTTVGDSRV